MKIKCKKCNDIIENREFNKERWCSCQNIGLFNDYILYGNKNELKEKKLYRFNTQRIIRRSSK